MQKKNIGIILSYILVLAEVAVGMLFTPILLKYMGSSEYGLYKLVVSWVSVISVLDFGLGGTITRYVVKYRAEDDIKGEENFLGIAFRIYVFLSVFVVLIGIIISFILPDISKSILPEQIARTRIAFLILMLKTALLLLTHAYTGWLTAYERFTESKMLAIINIVLRLALVCVLLPICPSVYVVVGVDTLLTVLQLAANIVICKKVIPTQIRLKKWDWKLVKEIFNFTVFLFLASVINQFNSNIDSIVLGIYTTTKIVGLYSCAMQIYTLYSSLSTAIQEVYLPSISKTVFKGADNKTVTESLVFPSRLQIYILFLALTGYILFGKSFFELWIGKSYNAFEINLCYITGLVIMVSSTVQLFQNTVTCVLKAKNMMGGRVLITGISTIVNFVLTMLLVPHYGTLGAASGTAVSMVFGYTVAANFYYKNKVGINVGLYFKKCLGGVWLSALLSLFIGCLIIMLPMYGLFGLIIKACLFCGVYAILLYLIGIGKDEKKIIIQRISGFLSGGNKHESF